MAWIFRLLVVADLLSGGLELALGTTSGVCWSTCPDICASVAIVDWDSSGGGSTDAVVSVSSIQSCSHSE